MVQRIYGLLLDHPEGMTLLEIHEHFRDGWLETDAYRAYEKLIFPPNPLDGKIKGNKQLRLDTNDSATSRKRRVPAYGTPEFEVRAQRWWLQKRLYGMSQTRTARREGTGQAARWYAGERAPRVMVGCEAPKRGYHIVPLNAARAKALADADNAAHVRREELKSELLEALNDRRFKGRGRELAQRAYDYLIGH
jgi:hypothetical protein